jgi:uncharacterized protein (TIGR02466 family)|tara:strand:- start:4200 stop:4835 length:636 start_codon:yes stop_codon:yes gene_type:complete
MVEWFICGGGKKMIGNFFSTPIYMGNIENRGDVDKELSDATDRAIFKNDWQPDNDTANTTFNPQGSTDIIREFNMQKIRSHIIDHANKYLKEIDYSYKQDSLQILGSWLNTFEKDQVIGLHEHGYQPNTFSGSYYYKVPKNSGNIQFKSTNPFVISFPHQSDKYSNLLNVEPESGMILLFPSWLMHKVLPNKSDETRISLAFNIYFDYKGK